MQIGTCPKCKKPVLPHLACRFCGTYAGRTVFTPKVKETKVMRRAKATQAEGHDHAGHDHDKHDHAAPAAETKKGE